MEKRVPSTKRRKKKKSKLHFLPVIILIVFVVLVAAAYLLFAFSNISFIANWRRAFTETALSTADHQWLAYTLLPDSYVDGIKTEIEKKAEEQKKITGGEKNLKKRKKTDETSAVETEEDNGGFKKVPDILNQKNISVGDIDYAGYKVVLNDIDEGLLVSEIVEGTYRGMVMLVDDPSRVYVGTTTSPGVEGLRMPTMLATYGAIAGINASGFADPGECGTGGDVIGRSYSNGVAWGYYVDYYGSVILTDTDHLVVGNIGSWEDYNVRDGIQFGPVLIADGVPQVQGAAGYNTHPRTCIGQREDGVIVMLVIDGRQFGWSSGCTVGDLVAILQKYNVINAACCDGGSSSVLAYNGKVLNKNSSANPTLGRRLPNAFLVKPKAQS